MENPMNRTNTLFRAEGDWSTVGTFGGECFHAHCKARGADWYHRAYRRYYCERCAAEIDAVRARLGETNVCSWQPWFREAGSSGTVGVASASAA
jgi:hypothetical protein